MLAYDVDSCLSVYLSLGVLDFVSRQQVQGRRQFDDRFSATGKGVCREEQDEEIVDQVKIPCCIQSGAM